MTDPALQYTLTAPDHCKGEGCDCRLSVADLGGLCVNCQYALEQAAKKKPERRGTDGRALPRRSSHYERRICKCGRGPIVRNYNCADCNREKALTAVPRRKSRALPVTKAGVKYCACRKAPVMKKRPVCHDCHAADNKARRRGEPPPQRGQFKYTRSTAASSPAGR
jgi:hypothetical protein